MATSHRQSFKESGSDEARDNEEDPEVCSNCATDGKLQPASYFCYNCGVFGRYICGKCLTHHNRYVKSHRIKLMSNQPISRGQTLETELETERNNVEELRHKLDDSMKQIETYLKERQTLETELETERKNVEELRHKLDDSMKQIEKYLKERQTLETELETERKNVEELRHKLDDSMKQIEKYLKEREKLETELEAEKNTLKDQFFKLDDRKNQIEMLENDWREMNKKNKLLEDKLEQLSKRFEEENKIRKGVENDLKSARGMALGLEKLINDHFLENEKHQKRILVAESEATCKHLEATCKDLYKQKYYIEQQANKNMDHMQSILKEEKRKSDDEYKKLLAERDDLRDRFSKLVGKKLQEQNPDIADRFDPNRATKLSEKFGQLYDDEWTNAFESLTDKKLGVPLKDAINVLLRLLQECWTFCYNLMATRMDSLQKMCLHPAPNLANFDQKKTGLTERPRVTTNDQLSLKDLRKRVGVSSSVIEEVKQALLADSKTWDKRGKKEFDKSI